MRRTAGSSRRSLSRWWCSGTRTVCRGRTRQVVWDDPVGDRAAPERRAPASHRHAPACRERARLQPDRRAQTAHDHEGRKAMSLSTTRVDLEEIEITMTEKLLAVVLVVFLYGRLVGVLEDRRHRPVRQPRCRDVLHLVRAGGGRASGPGSATGSARQEVAVQQARQDLELAREAYRTALDAGSTAPALEEDGTAPDSAISAAAQADGSDGPVRKPDAAGPAADAAYRRASNEALGGVETRAISSRSSVASRSSSPRSRSGTGC